MALNKFLPDPTGSESPFLSAVPQGQAGDLFVYKGTKTYTLDVNTGLYFLIDATSTNLPPGSPPVFETIGPGYTFLNIPS